MLKRIDNYFKLKLSSIGDPDIYFGAKLNKTRLDNGVWEWENSPSIYVKESVENVEKYLAKLADASWQFPNNKADNTFVRDYATYMD